MAFAQLADANEARDWRIGSDLAALSIRRARKPWADDSLGVDLNDIVCALDPSTIDPHLSLFEGASFRSTRAAIKLLSQLRDHRTRPPAARHPHGFRFHAGLEVADRAIPEAGRFGLPEQTLRVAAPPSAPHQLRAPVFTEF